MTERIPSPSYKIVLLGESLVGKTSLVNRFTTDKFDQTVSNTIGAAFITKPYSSSHPPHHTVEFQIWDTAGQERYLSLTPMYYRNAKVALVCIDLTNPTELLELAKYWMEQLKLHDCKIKLVGTKLDLVSATEYSELIDFARQSGLKVYLTSSKTGEGVSDIFDDIVDEIDPEFFEQWAKQKRLELQAKLSKPKKTSCC